MKTSSSTTLALLTVASLASLAACDKGRASSSTSGSQPAASAAPASGDSPLVLAPRDGIHWEPAPAGVSDAAVPVRAAIEGARAEGRTLIVYVGATWCEPCQRFHHAVEQGELDAAFPHLSFVAFDADRDAQALATAGYKSRLIPLFAIPLDDGRASGKQIEGSVKGEAAVSEITPRLRALLGSGS